MFAMPGTFSCELCGYIAGSHRMLARHRATTHETKVFRCSECPFVTRYRTNLYRHRREIHGLNKVSACAFCGFFASTTDDLRIHRQTCPAGGLQEIQSQPFFQNEIPQYEMYSNDYVQFGTVPNFKEPFPVLSQPPINDYNPFNQTPSYNEPYNFVPVTQPTSSKVSYEVENAPDMFVLPPTISQIPITKEKITTETPKNPDSTKNNELTKRFDPIKINEMAKKLEPAKVRRSYVCEPCDLKTTNPREYLAHRRDIHKEKITIYECKYCIYASKNPQKLQRHYGLVHRQISSIKRTYTSIKRKTQVAKKSCVSHKKNKFIKPEIRKEEQNIDDVISDPITSQEETLPKQSSSENIYNETDKESIQKTIQQKFKCSACHFHTKSKLVLLHHEKTKHLKKKFYRCLQCVYVTHVKSRYTKHVRYHSLSKVKCPHCDFKTAYKWNLDRHMKNHVSEGTFRCSKCCFSAHSKQSLTIHIVNHHSESINSINDIMIVGDNSDEEKNLHTSYTDLASTNEERLVENETIEIEREDESRNIHASRNNGNKKVNSELLNDSFLKSPLIENVSVAKPKMQKAVKSSGSAIRRMTEHSEKKYSCPLCEVTFDHLAWLARHLNHRHNNEQAKDISAIVQMLAAKSKPGAVSKLKNRKNGKKTHRATPVCAVCGYKTKWFSEMKRHMRVHTDEKPFECPFCDYKCRWKGDLTRHVQKRHDEITTQNSELHSKSFIKPPEEGTMMPLKHKRSCVIKNERMKKYFKKSDDQDSPLDLSVDRNIALPSRYQNDFLSFIDDDQLYGSEKDLQKNDNNYYGLSKMSRSSSTTSKNSLLMQSTKAFSCVFCDFTTSNEFNFKVHNTRHFTKYPFMCSTCSFRSNWQLKIVKHIKVKQQVNHDHDDARVLLIDSKGDITECDNDIGEDIYSESITKQEDNDNLSDGQIMYHQYTRSKGSSKKFKTAFMMNESSKSYFCRYCKYKDTERRNVLSHICEHTGQKPYHCRVCGFRSLWLNVLKRHVRRRHKGRLSDIEESFKIIEKNHVVSVIGSTLLRIVKSENSKITTLCSCKICPYKCMGQNVLENHMKHHNPVRTASYKCRFCPYYCKFKDTIVKHLNVHGMSESNATKIISQCKVAQIDESHSREKYRCSYCPFRTDNSTNYLYHKQCHRPNRNALFKCKHCSFWANRESVLDDHIKLHSRRSHDHKSSKGYPFHSMPIPIEIKQNGKTIEVYRCRFCPMMGDNLEIVFRHESLHLRNSKMFKCNICKKICESDKHLTSHLRTHTNPIQNDFTRNTSDSDGSFRKNSINKSFPRRPEDSKFNYFCTKCPAAFANKSDFTIHREIHQNTGNSLYISDFRDYENEKYSRNYSPVHSRNKGQVYNEEENNRMEEHQNYNAEKETGKDNSEWNQQANEQATENTGFEQMLLLEEAETKSFVNANNSSVLPQKLHNCFQCPAAFCKPAILAFHVSLHGTQGRYMCPECNYATDSKNNVIAHYQLHVKPKSANKNNLRLYECTKCPAKFQKPKGLRKHFSLHGQKNKFTCEICDYSVPCAVNLFRHKVVHANINNNTTTTTSNNSNSSNSQTEHNYVQEQPPENSEQIIENIDQIPNQKETVEQKKSPKSERLDEKRYFSCTFCPYVHPRKFAVQNHMRRHASTEGLKCPHCNYRSLQASVLRDHLKWHFQAQFVFNPQAFMKYDRMEVWMVNGKENQNELIFKDHGQGKNDKGDRFSSVSEQCFENEEPEKPSQLEDENRISKIVEEELQMTVEDDDEEEEEKKNEDEEKNEDEKKKEDEEEKKKEDEEEKKEDKEKKEDEETKKKVDEKEGEVDEEKVPEYLEKLKQLAMKKEVKIVLMDVFSQDKNSKNETSETIQKETDTSMTENQCIPKRADELVQVTNDNKEKPKENTVQHCEESNSSDSTVVLETPLENTGETNAENTTATSEVVINKEKPITLDQNVEMVQTPQLEDSNTLVIKEGEIESSYLDRTAPTICEYSNTMVNEDENNLHTHLYGNDVMMVRFDDDYLPSESGITEVIEVGTAPVPDVDLSLDTAMVDKEGIMGGDMNAMFSDDVQVVEVVAENEDSLNDFSTDLKDERDRNSSDLLVSCHANNFTADCEPTSIAEVEIKV